MPPYPVAPEGLPTRDEFFESRLIVNEQCAICHEHFDAEHCLARINTPGCTHVFGADCLRKWANSDNKMSHTCPVCRTVLFNKPKIPQFKYGARSIDISSSWLHLIDDRVEAEKFVKSVWGNLWHLFQYSAVYDADIEEQINEALRETAENYYHIEGLYICSAQWPAVLTVAKGMVRSHYSNGAYLSSDETLRTTWIPKMTQALGWDFDRRTQDRLNHEALEGAPSGLSRAELLDRLAPFGSDEDDMWDDGEDDEEMDD